MRDYIYVTQYILTKQKCEYIHMCTGGLCCVCVVWCVATGTPLFHHRQGSHRAHHRSLNVHKLEIFKAQPSQSFPIKKPFGPCTPVRLQKWMYQSIRVSPEFFCWSCCQSLSSSFSSVETFFFVPRRRGLTYIPAFLGCTEGRGLCVRSGIETWA